jgi:hypothetical protein
MRALRADDPTDHERGAHVLPGGLRRLRQPGLLVVARRKMLNGER